MASSAVRVSRTTAIYTFIRRTLYTGTRLTSILLSVHELNRVRRLPIYDYAGDGGIRTADGNTAGGYGGHGVDRTTRRDGHELKSATLSRLAVYSDGRRRRCYDRVRSTKTVEPTTVVIIIAINNIIAVDYNTHLDSTSSYRITIIIYYY